MLHPATASGFSAARSRWNSRPFNHYRLVLDYKYAYGFYFCYQDVEIQDERVIAIFQNRSTGGAPSIKGNCGHDPLTITDVFDIFEPFATKRTQGSGGPACGTVYVVRATYDAQLGFPHQIELQEQRDWLNPIYWIRRVCTDFGNTPRYDEFTVISLTPLPMLSAPQLTQLAPTRGAFQPTPQPTPTQLVATQPLIINGVSYPVPTDSHFRCITAEQTGANRVEYTLNVPAGWVVVWDAQQAYWPGGQYENGGLLTVQGPWEGMVKIVNGHYCAVPTEWIAFTLSDLFTAVPVREHCSIGAVRNPGCPSQ